MVRSLLRVSKCAKAKRTNLPPWTAELEYVNGGLFAGDIDAPRFDVAASVQYFAFSVPLRITSRT